MVDTSNEYVAKGGTTALGIIGTALGGLALAGGQNILGSLLGNAPAPAQAQAAQQYTDNAIWSDKEVKLLTMMYENKLQDNARIDEVKAKADALEALIPSMIESRIQPVNCNFKVLEAVLPFALRDSVSNVQGQVNTLQTVMPYEIKNSHTHLQDQINSIKAITPYEIHTAVDPVKDKLNCFERIVPFMISDADKYNIKGEVYASPKQISHNCGCGCGCNSQGFGLNPCGSSFPGFSQAAALAMLSGKATDWSCGCKVNESTTTETTGA